MPVSASDRACVEKMFKAMQAGVAGVDEMMTLYTPDAVVVEPFSGEVMTHKGTAALRQWFEDTANHGPPLTLTLDRVDMDGPVVVAAWTCTSEVFPTPMRGADRFTIKNGLIAKLEIEVTEMPDMGDA